MFRMFILAIILTTGLAKAEPPPPVPDGGLTHYKNEPCVDAESGLDGTCYYSHDIHNNRYRAFYVGDLAWAIYKLQDGEWAEIWRRGADV